MPRDVLNHVLRASIKVSTFRLTYRRAIGLVHAKVLFIDDFAIINNERSRGSGRPDAAPVNGFCSKARRPGSTPFLRAHSQTRKVSVPAIPGTLFQHRWRAARSSYFRRERKGTQ